MQPPAPFVQQEGTALAQAPPAALPAWRVLLAIMVWVVTRPLSALGAVLLEDTLQAAPPRARLAWQECMGWAGIRPLLAQGPALLESTLLAAPLPVCLAQREGMERVVTRPLHAVEPVLRASIAGLARQRVGLPSFAQQVFTARRQQSR
jgi:hypothetical protein